MKGSRIYLDLFKVFCDLADTKSFSHAAERNYISQSAVSQQISFLEKFLGKQLIMRGRGKFSLTSEGKIFLNGSEKILKQFQDIIDLMDAEMGNIIQTVNIETIYSIGFYRLPKNVKSFLKKDNKINLQIEYNRSDRIYKSVIQGSCDIGIIAFPWNHPLVKIHPVEKEKLVIVCAPDHKFATKKSISIKDLNRQNFIGFKKIIPTRNFIDEILFKNKTTVKIVQEFDNVETLKRTLEIGESLSILPENTIQHEIQNGDLVSIDISNEELFRSIGIITRKDRPISKAIQEALNHLFNL
jgi:LysR family transcriptional regulator, transcriptional activator of the cysJI operon